MFSCTEMFFHPIYIKIEPNCFTTSAKTAISVWPSVISDASIASSPFKRASNYLILTILLNNPSRPIGLISECPT